MMFLSSYILDAFYKKKISPFEEISTINAQSSWILEVDQK